MEIIRKNELQEILELVEMKPYGKFLITGVAGSGVNKRGSCVPFR